jgi:hypothetical protein
VDSRAGGDEPRDQEVDVVEASGADGAAELEAEDQQEQGALDGPDDHQLGRAAAMLRGYFASLPADQFSNMVATVDELSGGGPEERFELDLDVILRGLASYARP